MSDSTEPPGGPPRSPEARRAATRSWGRLSVVLLYVLGFYILLAPWLGPRILGWEKITELVGGEGVFLRVAVAVLFIYFATSTQEKYGLKFLTQDILEAMNMLLYGQDYRQHREAVTQQIARLKSSDARARKTAHRVLTELTGQGFPAQFEPWAAWWERARHTFRLRKGAHVGAADREERAT